MERENLKKAGVGLSRVRGESWSFRGLEDLFEDGVVLSCLEGELVKRLTTGL